MLILVSIAYGFLRAWLWMKVFNTFPGPEFGLPALTWRQAYAAAMVLGLIQFKVPGPDVTTKQLEQRVITHMVSETIALLLAWGIGYLIGS